MKHTLPSCTVEWCDQGTRPHTEHELTVGTWPGVAQTGRRRTIVAQLVIHGHSTAEAAPMLALVDDLTQTDVVLTWEQADQLVAAIITGLARLG